MSGYILDKAYGIDETEGVDAYLIVIQGTNPGECKLPGAANAGGILGVTVHNQLPGANVAVSKAGIARVRAAGAIAVGAPVNIAGPTGKVKAINEPSGTKINCLGFAETQALADGDEVEVFLSLHQRIA